MKLKNQDKIKVGARVYDWSISEWGTITEIDSCLVAIKYDNYEDEDGNNELWEENCYVYPLAEGVRLKKDKDVEVCLEVNAEVDYPYYVPDYDENAYEIETTTPTKA